MFKTCLSTVTLCHFIIFHFKGSKIVMYVGQMESFEFRKLALRSSVFLVYWSSKISLLMLPAFFSLLGGGDEPPLCKALDSQLVDFICGGAWVHWLHHVVPQVLSHLQGKGVWCLESRHNSANIVTRPNWARKVREMDQGSFQVTRWSPSGHQLVTKWLSSGQWVVGVISFHKICGSMSWQCSCDDL